MHVHILFLWNNSNLETQCGLYIRFVASRLAVFYSNNSHCLLFCLTIDTKHNGCLLKQIYVCFFCVKIQCLDLSPQNMIMASVQHSLDGSILSYTHSSRWSLCQTAQCLDWEWATQFLLLQTLAKDLKLDCEKIHIVLYGLELPLCITPPLEKTL